MYNVTCMYMRYCRMKFASSLSFRIRLTVVS